MTNVRELNKMAAKLITSAGVLALIAGINISITPTAFADDCLLDTNNDGDADSNVDTDGGADSGGNSFRLACGVGASAVGNNATALGRSASAAGFSSIALGNSANAAGGESTALGNGASSAGGDSTALGRQASSAGFGSTALGHFASAAADFSTALGRSASAVGDQSTAIGSSSQANNVDTIALGNAANAAGPRSTALGKSSSAGGQDTTALGVSSSAGGDSAVALGDGANAPSDNSTALGDHTRAFETGATAVGSAAYAFGGHSTAVGFGASAFGHRSLALGYLANDASGMSGEESIGIGASVSTQGSHSIVIGADAHDGTFADAIVIGTGASAFETGQIVLQEADVFTILGNGDMGLGTATPMGNLDVNSGADDTLLVLTNDTAQWAIKSNAANGKLTIGNNTTGTKPLKFGPNAVGNLLQIGIVATDQVDIKGDLVLVGTLTTGGPTCGGGCDAVFDADYDMLSIEEHAALMYANNYLPEIGPTVPHAPVNVSERMGTMLNELEKAHIYIADLNQEKQAMRNETAHLKSELTELKQQVALLMNK